MTEPATLAEASELLGEYPSLLSALGPGGGDESGVAVPGAAWRGRLDSPAALAGFLARFQAEILVPVEFPAILRAHGHTVRNEGRELIAFDGELSRDARLKDFAEASRRVGRSQIRRLRPVKHSRVVQRYLAASDDGLVHNWHTVVFGLTLGLYSLPLRQGLVHYAEKTLEGFVCAVQLGRGLDVAACDEILGRALAEVPTAVNALIDAPGRPLLTIS
jgi:urease accessory protein UreF